MCSRFIVERFTSANFSTGYVRLNSRYKHKQLLGEKSGTLLKKLKRDPLEWFRNQVWLVITVTTVTHLDVPHLQRPGLSSGT